MKIIINDLEVSPEEAIKLAQKEIEEYGKKKGLWRPNDGENIFVLWTDGRVGQRVFRDGGECEDWLLRGKIFKTIKDALADDDKRKALVRIKDYIAREGIGRFGMNERGIKKILVEMFGYSVENIYQACEADLKILFEV